MLHRNRSQAAPARRGFTLVEVLVVIVIILVLASLGVGAIMKVLSLQQRRNTEAEVSKVGEGFRKQSNAARDTARSEAPNPIAVALANGDPRRAQVIHVLMCMRREFPQSFTEATQTITVNGVGSFGPNPAYVRIVSNLSAPSQGRPANDQSSACLYMALKQTRRGTEFDPDGALSSQEVIDPFGDGAKEIQDAWGQPLVFNRWPASGFGSALLNPNGAQAFPPPAGQPPPDPQDPEGTLTNATWVAWLQANNNANLNVFNYAVAYPLGGAGKQFKLTPVIMSLGPKGVDDESIPGTGDIINFKLAPLSQ